MKKYIFGAIFSLVLLAAPLSTNAAGLSSDQIQAILSLLTSFGADSATVTNVQTSLTGSVIVTPPNGPFCHNFNSDITYGSRADEVDALQAVLIKERFLRASQAGFTGDVKKAAIALQAKYGIRQTGYVGPMTRAKLNSLYGCMKVSQVPQPVIVPVLTTSTTTPVVSSAAPTLFFGTTAGETGTITVPTGSPVTLQWNSAGADVCRASAVPADTSWQGSQLLPSGTHIITSVTFPETYTLTCSNSVGSVTGTFTITMSAQTASAPFISYLSPSSAIANSTVTIHGSNFDSNSYLSIGNVPGEANARSMTPNSTGLSTLSFVVPADVGIGPLPIYVGKRDTSLLSNSAILNVIATPPTVSVSASSLTVASGSTVSITWAATNATSCSGSGDSALALIEGKTTGTLTSSPITGPTVFGVTCTGPGGEVTHSVAVNVAGTNSPSPTATISSSPASVNVGQAPVVTWSSVNASYCTVTTGSTDDYDVGLAPLSGSKTIDPVMSNRIVNLSCAGPGGTITKALTVAIATPDITISASPASVAKGGTATIRWSAPTATSCTGVPNGDPAWAIASGITGTLHTYPISSDTTFAMTCTNTGGPATKSVTVTAI